MIPCRLSLLSPEKRQNLNSMVYFQFLKSILEILLIVISITGIILLGAQSVLEDYFSKLTSTIVFTQNQFAKTNSEIKNINETIKEVGKIQKEYEPINKIIKLFTTALPNELILNTVSYNQNTKILSLTGTALTRDSLLNFKEQLKSYPEVVSSDLPASQLTKKDMVPFSLNLKLK